MIIKEATGFHSSRQLARAYIERNFFAWPTPRLVVFFKVRKKLQEG